MDVLCNVTIWAVGWKDSKAEHVHVFGTKAEAKSYALSLAKIGYNTAIWPL